MSRSYKKFPVVRQEKVECHLANRYIRHNKDIEIPVKGAYYRKVKNFGWRWSYLWTKEQAIDDYYNFERLQKQFPSLEEYLIWYNKNFLSK